MLLFILSMLLIILILGQTPEIETLGDAFGGEQYISKGEKNVTKTIYVIVVLISIILLFFS